MFDWRRFGSVETAVVTVVGDQFGLYGRALALDAEFTDLGFDDVDRLEALIALEELFDIPLYDRAAEVRRVGDLVKLVERVMSEQTRRAGSD
jgi:acyl carrier protein